MKTMTRREVWVAVPGLAVAVASVSQAGAMQVHASESPTPKAASPVAGQADGAVAQGATAALRGPLANSRVFSYDDMAVRKSASGESRTITHGVLATGETVTLHESTQRVGAVPVALHMIQHSEFVCVSEGEVEFQHEVDGQLVAEKVSPGSVIFVVPGTNHRVVNTGTVPAKYFVVAIGGDTK